MLRKEKFIIFSDMHKGAKNGADDFAVCEPAYTTALDYYYQSRLSFYCPRRLRGALGKFNCQG
jgi:hypothetical protein